MNHAAFLGAFLAFVGGMGLGLFLSVNTIIIHKLVREYRLSVKGARNV